MGRGLERFHGETALETGLGIWGEKVPQQATRQETMCQRTEQCEEKLHEDKLRCGGPAGLQVQG